MKTAMHELWDYIDANYHEEGFNLYDAKEISLEKEKEQINKACYDGYYQEELYDTRNYYDQTYSQEPKKEYQPSEKYLKKQKELMEDFIWNKMNKNNQNK